MERDLLREAVLKGLKEPVVFKNLIERWPAVRWNFTNIDKIFGEHLLNFRVGKNDISEINFETECHHRRATASEFCEWLGNSCSNGNPLKDLCSNEHWCYADYKHLFEIFGEDSKIHQSIDWSGFGFPGRGGRESTIWIGSRGATTVCHSDTYGCNLVAQICGRKRWILFPPEQSGSMYQTRLPFEESSHFSQVNIIRPNLEKFPLFKGTTPHIVTLHPGDVLFVPRHWWHHVHSLDNSISINTWLELQTDHLDRVREAVVRNIVFKMMDSDQESSWLNPTEDYTCQEDNLELLNLAANAYLLNAEKSDINKDDNYIGCDSGSHDKDDEAKIAGKHTRKRTSDDTSIDTTSSKKLRSLSGDQTKTHDGDIIISREFDEKHVVRIFPSMVDELLKISSHRDGAGDGSSDVGGECYGVDGGSGADEPSCSSSASPPREVPGSLKSSSCPANRVTSGLLTRAMLQHDVIKCWKWLVWSEQTYEQATKQSRTRALTTRHARLRKRRATPAWGANERGVGKD